MKLRVCNWILIVYMFPLYTNLVTCVPYTRLIYRVRARMDLRIQNKT